MMCHTLRLRSGACVGCKVQARYHGTAMFGQKAGQSYMSCAGRAAGGACLRGGLPLLLLLLCALCSSLLSSRGLFLLPCFLSLSVLLLLSANRRKSIKVWRPDQCKGHSPQTLAQRTSSSHDARGSNHRISRDMDGDQFLSA